MSLIHWLGHLLAFDSVSDDEYAANSGSLGWIIPPFLTLVGLYLGWRWHQQCALGRCYRRAKFDADGHKICHKHAGKHKKLTLTHLAHFHRTGTVPTPSPEHVNQEEHQ